MSTAWRSAVSHVGLLVVAVLYVAVSVAYSLIVPLGETPDEPAHYDFVRYVALHHALPIQRMATDNAIAEGHQAPLYYSLAAFPLALTGTAESVVLLRPSPDISFAIDGQQNKHALVHTVGEAWPFTGFVLGWHVVRLFSVACGLMAVILTYAYAGLVFRCDRAPMLASAAVVGINPQFAFITGAASNDGLTAALGTAMLLLAALAVSGERMTAWRCALCGVVAGLAILTKLTLAVPAAVAFLVLLHSLWRRDGWFRRLALALLCASAIAGWWFVRNLVLYGDPLALNVDRAQNPSLVWDEGKLTLRFALDVFAAARLSYVARFGWMNVAPSPLVDDLVAGLAIVAAAGLALLLCRLLLRRLTGLTIAPLAVGALYSLAMLASQVVAAVVKGASAFQGRYMFAATAAIAVLLVVGLAQLSGRRLQWLLAVGALLGGLALNYYCLVRVIAPTYPDGLPIVYDDRHGTPATAIGARVGPAIELLGLDADEREESGQRRLALTLHWRAGGKPTGDHTAFVHLVDASSGNLVAQSDQIPLASRAPPSLWRPGEIILDSHVLDLSSLPAGRYVLHVGMYNLRDLLRLPVVTQSDGRADHVEVPIDLGDGR